MNFKLFDGLNREYKYSAAKQTVRRVEALQDKAGNDISVLVEKLYNQMENYRTQMASIEASLAFAEEYLKTKNAAFLEGMSSSTDLIDAELNLAKVKTERIEAAYRYDVSLANCSKPPASATNSPPTCAGRTPAASHSRNSKNERDMKKKNIIAVLVAVVVIIAAVLLVSRYLKARTPILLQGTTECTTYKLRRKSPAASST